MSWALPRSPSSAPRRVCTSAKDLTLEQRRQVVADVCATTYRAAAAKWGISVGCAQRLVAKARKLKGIHTPRLPYSRRQEAQL
jgi:hypothetical protein